MSDQKLIGIFDIVTLSIDEFISQWKKYIILSVLQYSPSFVFGVALIAVGLQFATRDQLAQNLMENLSINLLIFIFAFIIVNVLIQGLVYITYILIAKDNSLSVKDGLKKSWELLIPISVPSLLVLLIVLGGIILFVVPGIVLAIWYSYTLLTAIDGKRGKEALAESKRLVKGRWWGTFVRLIVPGIIVGLVTVVIELPFGVSDNKIFSFIGTAIASIIVAPISALTLYILYKSAKDSVPNSQ